MNLRRPTEKLAGCMWLARFVDKARLFHAGALSPDYLHAFCHPLGTDSAFLGHFSIAKDDMLRIVVESCGDDGKVASWFTSRAESSLDRIAEWNTLAPNLGREGYPLRRAYLWACKQWNSGGFSDTRVVSVFTAIAFDEGYLDTLIKEAEPGATDNSDGA